jgi:hypothetical protein
MCLDKLALDPGYKVSYAILDAIILPVQIYGRLGGIRYQGAGKLSSLFYLLRDLDVPEDVSALSSRLK